MGSPPPRRVVAGRFWRSPLFSRNRLIVPFRSMHFLAKSTEAAVNGEVFGVFEFSVFFLGNFRPSRPFLANSRMLGFSSLAYDGVRGVPAIDQSFPCDDLDAYSFHYLKQNVTLYILFTFRTTRRSPHITHPDLTHSPTPNSPTHSPTRPSRPPPSLSLMQMVLLLQMVVRPSADE